MNDQRCSIRHSLHEGLKAVAIENDLLRLVVLPELGGKIVSLIRRQSGYEYLLQPLQPNRAYRRRPYGAKFEYYGPSGFDECVPTIAECRYPEEPLSSRRCPDHGDVWCLPASVEIVGEQAIFTSALRSLPLRFTKKVQLQANSVRIDYEVTNLNQSRMKFLWSAHPLLRTEPEAEIILPPEVHEVEVEWSKDERLGKPGDKCSWPKAIDNIGRMIQLSKILSPTAGTAEKLFTPRLSEGFCGMFLPCANESIAFRFDPRLVPYVGVWICQGGWPPSQDPKQFTVALEPCNGRPDSLNDAIRRDECAVVDGLATTKWWMEIEVNCGPPRLRV